MMFKVWGPIVLLKELTALLGHIKLGGHAAVSFVNVLYKTWGLAQHYWELSTLQ